MYSELSDFASIDHSFIQRIRLKNGNFVFYIAGNSDEATFGAGIYLKKEWMSLAERFHGDNDFGIILKTVSGNILSSKEIAVVEA